MPTLRGLALGASLIIAIGAQNAYVLSQGLRRQHVFAVALVCSLCDAALITLGVAGVGTIIASSQVLTQGAAWGGAAFLLWYGFGSFRSAFRRRAMDEVDAPQETARLGQTLLKTLAVSLLNPHVYLDTVVLIGSIGGQYAAAERPLFGLGAVTASFAWFFGLGYGAAVLTPLFRRPIAWRVLDTLIGCIMWAIAASLIVTARG